MLAPDLPVVEDRAAIPENACALHHQRVTEAPRRAGDHLAARPAKVDRRLARKAQRGFVERVIEGHLRPPDFLRLSRDGEYADGEEKRERSAKGDDHQP